MYVATNYASIFKIKCDLILPLLMTMLSFICHFFTVMYKESVIHFAATRFIYTVTLYLIV